MLRTARRSPLLLLAVLLAACSDRVGTGPTTPSDVTGPFVSSHEACTADPARIQELIDLVFPDLSPSNSAADAHWANIQRKFEDGDVADARNKTTNFVAFILSHYQSLDAAAREALEDEVVELVNALYCFVGLDFTIEDPDNTWFLQPSDPEKFFFSEDGTLGIRFDPDAVPQGTIVTAARGAGNLETLLDQYPFLWNIELQPGGSLNPGKLATVVICPDVQSLPSDQGLWASLLARLRLGHQQAPGEAGFRILPPPDTEQAFELDCGFDIPEATLLGVKLPGWLQRLATAVLPARLHASVFFLRAGGVGGNTSEFSPFSPVDPMFTAVGGVGGNTSEFTPMSLGPALSETPDPVPAFTGPAGEEETPLVDRVRVVTALGQNPVPGVKVTWTLLPVSDEGGLDKADATFCGGAGSVEKTTDDAGYVDWPCINFGPVLGYMNLKAEFDPSDVVAQGGEFLYVAPAGTDTEGPLYFLVQTVPGPAAQIFTYLPLAEPVAAASYDYGTGAEDQPVNPAPRVLVTDQFGHAVGAGIGVTWAPLVASNGAVLTVNGGGSTSADGTAQAQSWVLGAGLSQVFASITGLGEESPLAEFRATAPTGQTIYSCELGGNKTDLGRLQFNRPGNNTIRTVTVWMSVTGQASSVASYPATVQIRKGNMTSSTVIGSGAGNVVLPGNNGIATPVTFELTDRATGSETSGSGNLYIDIAVETPSQRKIQVWHVNNPRNGTTCYNTLVYAPGSTTSFKRGLSLLLTN